MKMYVHSSYTLGCVFLFILFFIYVILRSIHLRIFFLSDMRRKYLKIHFCRWNFNYVRRFSVFDNFRGKWRKNESTYTSGRSSRTNGSFKRVFSSLPNLTILPTSTRSFSLLAKYFLRRFFFFSESSILTTDSTEFFRSFSFTQCSSTLRWNTAETRKRVICSWLIWVNFFHVVSRRSVISAFFPLPNLQDCLRAKEAFSSWQP